jgi:hypothetical protein
MSAEDARSVIRVSIGAGTTADEIGRVPAALDRTTGTLRQGILPPRDLRETEAHRALNPWRRAPGA